MLCVPLRRVRAGEVRCEEFLYELEVRCEEFLYELKAGPAGGRLRRPSSRRQRRDGYRRADRALARGFTYTT
jgi:hypothetical protein